MGAQIHIQRIAEHRYTYTIVLRIYGYNPEAREIDDLYPLRFRRVVGSFPDRMSAQAFLKDAYKKTDKKRLSGRGVKKLMDRGKNEFRLRTTGGNEWAWDIRANKVE